MKFFQENAKIAKYSLSIAGFISLIQLFKGIRIELKKQKENRNILQVVKTVLKDYMLEESKFLFFTLFTTNLTMHLMLKLKLPLKKVSFFLGFIISYLFVVQNNKQVPITISFYVLARILTIYIKKMQKAKIISSNIPIMKILFLILITILNYNIVNYPEFISKSMVKNYKYYGNYSEELWLDMGNTAKVIRSRNLNN